LRRSTNLISSSAGTTSEKKWKGLGAFDSGSRILRLEGKKSFFKEIKVSIRCWELICSLQSLENTFVMEKKNWKQTLAENRFFFHLNVYMPEKLS